MTGELLIPPSTARPCDLIFAIMSPKYYLGSISSHITPRHPIELISVFT